MCTWLKHSNANDELIYWDFFPNLVTKQRGFGLTTKDHVQVFQCTMSTPAKQIQKNEEEEIWNKFQKNQGKMFPSSFLGARTCRVWVSTAAAQRLTETVERSSGCSSGPSFKRPKLSGLQKWRQDRNCISPILATVFLLVHQMHFFHFLKPKIQLSHA